MKLYASLTSPYARKVRIALAEKAVECEFVQADPVGAESPVPALNPLGKVPVLVRDDGSVLFDSPLILEWLDGVKPPALAPAGGEDRIQVLLWQALADGIMDAAVSRMIEARRAEEHQSKTSLAHQDGKIARAMAYADVRVGEGHLHGASLSLADIALVAALDYVDLRCPHGWRATYPKLERWHRSMAERASFVDTRPPGLARPS